MSNTKPDAERTDVDNAAGHIASASSLAPRRFTLRGAWGNVMADGVGRGLNVHAALAAAGVVGLWKYRIDLDSVICDEAMSRLYGIDPDEGTKGVPPSGSTRAAATLRPLP
ncbi:MAG: hypothetical protein EOO23_07090 [Comamonadaceae bacterium]|nr:MAG: hypothetical protein EOO23_07090 [Comamonadaceae bacterium]